jgi:hypothetical protein
MWDGAQDRAGRDAQHVDGRDEDVAGVARATHSDQARVAVT